MREQIHGKPLNENSSEQEAWLYRALQMLVASAASRIGGRGGVEEEDWWWYQRKVPMVSWWAALRVRPRKQIIAQRLFQIQVPSSATSCKLLPTIIISDSSMQIQDHDKNDSRPIQWSKILLASSLLGQTQQAARA